MREPTQRVCAARELKVRKVEARRHGAANERVLAARARVARAATGARGGACLDAPAPRQRTRRACRHATHRGAAPGASSAASRLPNQWPAGTTCCGGTQQWRQEVARQSPAATRTSRESTREAAHLRHVARRKVGAQRRAAQRAVGRQLDDGQRRARVPVPHLGAGDAVQPAHAAGGDEEVDGGAKASRAAVWRGATKRAARRVSGEVLSWRRCARSRRTRGRQRGPGDGAGVAEGLREVAAL